MKIRVAIVSALLALATASGCAAVGPTDPSNRDAQFCVTQNEGESLLCCPSPGLGCQAVEATNSNSRSLRLARDTG